MVTGLICKECHQRYPLEERFCCEQCWAPVEPTYRYDSLETLRANISAGPPSLWRYGDFLPFERRESSPLPCGMTPLIRADRLAREIGVREVWVKNETANPTHSFKDRVVSVAMRKAFELGYETVGCASTGNLAQSVAAYAAAYGLRAVIFTPKDLEPQKLASLAAYGARLVTIDGNYDQTNRLCQEIAQEYRWAFINFTLRPFYAEGSKTLAYEIVEQMGRLPTRAVFPIASGSLFTRAYRAFEEWRVLGLAEGDAPKMHGGQASGCSPVAQAYALGVDRVKAVKPDSSVTSLAIGDPADGDYALAVAAASGGSIETAPEEDIPAAIKRFAELTGIFTEGAGGVTAQALFQLAEKGQLDSDDSIAVAITGDGLKTPDLVDPVIPEAIPPRLDAFQATL